eukprot:25259_1
MAEHVALKMVAKCEEIAVKPPSNFMIRLDTTTPTSSTETSLDDTISSPSKHTKKKLKWSRKSPNKIYLFLYNLIMPFLVICSAAYFAFQTNLPFIFPSLGPTAFLHFAIPGKAPSSPKNTLCGHMIGILAGSFALQVTDLYDHDVIFREGVILDRVFCAAMSVGITCGFMVLLKVAHPPAGATTLIVSLGILKTPFQLAVMMTAVLLITIEAFILNRIFRADAIYPFWSIPNENSAKSSSGNKDSDFSLLRGFSSFRLSRMNMKYTSLKKKMDSLSVDNFLDCFEICSELEDEPLMTKLIEFIVQNRDELNDMNDFHDNVPFAVRYAIDNYFD